MAHCRTELDDDDEVMRRCRRVRDEFDRRFKNLDEQFAWLAKLEKEGGPRRYVKLPLRHNSRATGRSTHVPVPAAAQTCKYPSSAGR